VFVGDLTLSLIISLNL